MSAIWGLDLTPVVALPALTGPSDTFTDSDNVQLGSHVPTGPNAGSGWTVWNGAQKILSNQATDSNSGSGNRATMNNDLGSDQMDVEAEFTSTAVAGNAVTVGVYARGTTSAVGIEFKYDFSTSKWVLEDPNNPGTVHVETAGAWPGGTVTMRIRARTGSMEGWVNGTQKLTLSTNNKSGQTRGGIMLSLFQGLTNPSRCDNYKSMAF